MFTSARWYDLGIDWDARLAREIPVLAEVFGPPGPGGILDAGCGTGRQAVALAQSGYRVTGLDAERDMLDVAAELATQAGADVHFVHAPYADLPTATAGGFDGVYTLANALAAAGDGRSCRQAVHNMANALRPGGRLFVQILNFRTMRAQEPCVRGPRVAVRDGTEYVSVRHFTFVGDECGVTNVTLWHDGAWRQRAHTGRLYPADVDEVTTWCHEANLRIDHCFGDYSRKPFDASTSVDLILVATRPAH